MGRGGTGALTESMKSSERLERCRRYGFDCAGGRLGSHRLGNSDRIV